MFIETRTDDKGTIDGRLPYDVDYDRLAMLITANAPFSQDVLVSFIVSAGGLSESTQRNSSKALMAVLGEPDMGEFYKKNSDLIFYLVIMFRKYAFVITVIFL